jgi:hypothetical protein
MAKTRGISLQISLKSLTAGVAFDTLKRMRPVWNVNTHRKNVTNEFTRKSTVTKL